MTRWQHLHGDVLVGELSEYVHINGSEARPAFVRTRAPAKEPTEGTNPLAPGGQKDGVSNV